MKKFIICLLLASISSSLFASITKDDLISFYSKPDGAIILENYYSTWWGYAVYGKDGISHIDIYDKQETGAFVDSFGRVYRISVSQSYYDEQKNILYLYIKR